MRVALITLAKGSPDMKVLGKNDIYLSVLSSQPTSASQAEASRTLLVSFTRRASLRGCCVFIKHHQYSLWMC